MTAMIMYVFMKQHLLLNELRFLDENDEKEI